MKKREKLEKDIIKKISETLTIGNRSQRTIDNYKSSINRFINYYQNKNLKKITESDIINYLKIEILDKNKTPQTYNANLFAIKYMYSVYFNKKFNDDLLPVAKLDKTLPYIVSKEIFLKIINNENNIKHKCILLLAYCSGLRVSEIATIKIQDIQSSIHKLKVYGKGKKERYTILPDITIKYLRLYYKEQKMKKKKGYLFEGISNKEHINSKSISNYFTSLKDKYDLSDEITAHTFRHSFATNFIKAGGEPFVLKTLLGHKTMTTTSMYVHLADNYDNLIGDSNAK